MGSYAQSVLIKDEKILYEAKISDPIQGMIVLLGIIFLFFYGLGLLFFLWAYLNYKASELVITNKRVISKIGYFGRKTFEINLKNIESILIRQNIIGRLFNFGVVIIVGAGLPGVSLRTVAYPLEFRQRALEIMNQNNEGSGKENPVSI